MECSSIKRQLSEKECRQFLDYGTWCARGIFCIFMGYSPIVSEELFGELLTLPDGAHIWCVMQTAIRDNAIEALQRKGDLTGDDYAPCISWLKWAQAKSSIDIDPTLLKLANLPPKKYEVADQKIIAKTIIAQTAKLLLAMCPYIRIQDIIYVIEVTQSIENLPGEKTIRKYLQEAGVVLADVKPSQEKVEMIEKILELFSQPPSS